MTYASQAALARDADFSDRMAACLSEQAQIADDDLGKVILRQPATGAGLFMPFIATAPGFGEAYLTGGQSAITDADLLAAVQASWESVAAVAAWRPT